VANHGHKVGHVVQSDITSGTGVDGTYTVTAVTDANTFTYTAGTSLTTSGNITLNRRAIRASGNVANVAYVAAGDYIINKINAMPDTNYLVKGTVAVVGSYTACIYPHLTGVGGTEVAPSTNSFRIVVANPGTVTRLDAKYINVEVTR
jgi:hypothetical protein